MQGNRQTKRAEFPLEAGLNFANTNGKAVVAGNTRTEDTAARTQAARNFKGWCGILKKA